LPTCNCYAQTDYVGSTAGDCRPGNYEGSFAGLYTSGFTFIGVPIPIASLNLVPPAPGLTFTLFGTEGAGGEFKTLEIKNGVMQGLADNIFPIKGTISGTLDCGTKKFTGRLDGGYCVGPCLQANEAKFDGPVSGHYNGGVFTFDHGTWDLLEKGHPKGPLGNAYGGSGTWDAKWVSYANGAGAADAGP